MATKKDYEAAHELLFTYMNLLQRGCINDQQQEEQGNFISVSEKLDDALLKYMDNEKSDAQEKEIQGALSTAFEDMAKKSVKYTPVQLGLAICYTIVNAVPLVSYNLFWLGIFVISIFAMATTSIEYPFRMLLAEVIIYGFVALIPSLMFSMPLVLWIPAMRVWVRTIHLVAQLLPLVLSAFFVIFSTLFAILDAILMLSLYIYYANNPPTGWSGIEFIVLVPAFFILLIMDLFASINMIYFGVAFLTALLLFISHMKRKIYLLKYSHVTMKEFFTL